MLFRCLPEPSLPYVIAYMIGERILGVMSQYVSKTLDTYYYTPIQTPVLLVLNQLT